MSITFVSLNLKVVFCFYWTVSKLLATFVQTDTCTYTCAHMHIWTIYCTYKWRTVYTYIHIDTYLYSHLHIHTNRHSNIHSWIPTRKNAACRGSTAEWKRFIWQYAYSSILSHTLTDALMRIPTQAWGGTPWPHTCPRTIIVLPISMSPSL